MHEVVNGVVISKEERLKKELETAISFSDMELALAVCDDLIEMDPDRSEFHVSRGVILAKNGKIPESIEEIDKAINIDSTDKKAWYSKGCILMDNGKPKPALACFYKTLDLDPAHEKALSRFLRCLDSMKEQSIVKEDAEVGIYHDGPSLVGEEREEKPVFNASFEDDEIESDEYHVSPPLPDEAPDLPGRRKGSFLDDDLFEDDEEWGDFDDEEDEDEEDEDEDEEWEEDEEEEEEPLGFVECRCGGSIPIYSDERPYRFECPDCGRTGKLR